MECEKCHLQVDYNRAGNPCNDCIEEEAPPPSQQPPPSSQRKATPCLCEDGPVAVNSMIQCTKCIRWWHPACVGLAGLNKHGCNKIQNWNCPLCFELPPGVKDKLGGDDTGVDSTSVRGIKEVVKKGMEEAMPKMIEKIQEQYNKQIENFKTEATELVGKTWAEVAKVGQAKIMTEVSQNTTETALKETMTFINTNLTEMQNRVNNVIISDLQETEEEDVVTTAYSVLQPVVDIPQSDIVKARRLGKAANGKNRMLMVTLRHEQDCKFLHNYKAGRKVVLANNREIWINADLTKTERDVAFQKREEQRARRAARPARPPPTADQGRPTAAQGEQDTAAPLPAPAAAHPTVPQQPTGDAPQQTTPLNT